MRLHRLPKVLGPIALAACSWAMAQGEPSAPAEASETTKDLPAPKPVEVIPGDPSQAPPEDDSTDSDVPPAPAPAQTDQSGEDFARRIHERLHPSTVPATAPDGTPAVTPVPAGEAPLPGVQPTPLQPVAGDGSATTLGPPPQVMDGAPATTIGAPPVVAVADAMSNLDVAAPRVSTSSNEWLKGFGFGGSLTAMYDTNIYQTSGRVGLPDDGDFVFGFSPYISYGSDKYGLVYQAKLVLDADDYASHSDISGVGYAADFKLGYDGRKFRNDFSIGSELAQGVDRNYGAYLQRQIFKIDDIIAYKLSHKTSIEGRLGYSSESPDDRRFFDTSKEYVNIAMAWKYSSLLKLSGGLGWSRSEGDRQVTRDTIGPLLRANYKYSSKLSFDGETGLDFVSYDGGGSSDPFFSARIAASYVPSPFWAFDLSILRDSVPDGSVAGSYRDVLAVRAGVKKRVMKGSISLGLGYEQNQYTREGTGTVVSGLDRDYLTVDLSAAYPIYRDSVNLEVFTKYRDESADDSNRSWSGTQFGFALRSNF